MNEKKVIELIHIHVLIYWVTWGNFGVPYQDFNLIKTMDNNSFFTIVLYIGVLASLSVELFDPLFIVFEIQSRSGFLIWDIFLIKMVTGLNLRFYIYVQQNMYL